MSKITTPTTVRIDKSLKKQTDRDLKDMGLTFSSFVTMASKLLVKEGKLPFTPITQREINFKRQDDKVKSEIKNERPGDFNPKNAL